jgi:hypothetical protein
MQPSECKLGPQPTAGTDPTRPDQRKTADPPAAWERVYRTRAGGRHHGTPRIFHRAETCPRLSMAARVRSVPLGAVLAHDHSPCSTCYGATRSATPAEIRAAAQGGLLA